MWPLSASGSPRVDSEYLSWATESWVDQHSDMSERCEVHTFVGNIGPAQRGTLYPQFARYDMGEREDLVLLHFDALQSRRK